MGQIKFQSIRGMNDVGGDEIALWHHIEKTARELYENFGYQEIRTPILESTELFKRNVGESTDMVEKEMYTFADRNGDSLSLRPEGTAAVVRAVMQRSWLHDSPVLKLYYIGPMFRHERPQKGRLRQFYQIGIELFGIAEPSADVEVIYLQHQMFQRLQVKDYELRLSSIGCQVCRPPYREKLLAALKKVETQLCADCQRRIHINPLRVFDCKNESCQKIADKLPRQLDHLCVECQGHFAGVKDGLQKLGVPFVVDPKIVRGIDYYNRTAFEFVTSLIGAQSTICGGGRYDQLVEQFGGPSTPAVGFGLGIERLVLMLESRIAEFQPQVLCYFVSADPAGRARVLQLCYEMRLRGLRCEMDLGEKSMKAQMKRADKFQAKFAIIIGQSEIDKNGAMVKNLKSSTQQFVEFSKLESYVRAL